MQGGPSLRVAGRPEIAVDVAGAGPLVMFLHGIGGNRGNFVEQVAYFGARGWTAAAWDARGYGASGDYDGALDFADFADDLRRVLDHLGAARAALVGVSMGGRIALDFTGRASGRVAALALCDTSGGTDSARDPAKIEAFLNARRRPLTQEGKTPVDIAPGIAKSFAGPSITEAQFARLVESLSALRTESYLKTLEAVTCYDAFPPFEQLKVPTLTMTGEYDPIAPPDMIRAYTARIAGARYVEIAGAGHISNIERPDAFNAALEAFLSDVWPAAALRPRT